MINNNNFETTLNHEGLELKPFLDGNFKVLEIAESFGTIEDALPLLKEIWEGFQGLDSSIRVMKKFRTEGFYKVVTDPKENYGRTFDLYRVYYLADGTRCIGKQTVGSSLTNRAVPYTTFVKGHFVQLPMYMSKDARGRKEAIENTKRANNIMVGQI